MPTNTLLLRDLLKSRSPDLGLYGVQLVNNASQLLQYTLSSFPEGTIHTSDHTNVVELTAAKIIGLGFADRLSDEELLLLLLGCHYHDLGMAAPDHQNQSEKGRKQARKEHAITIGARIRTHWKSLGFRDETFAHALAEVCRGHRPNRDDDHVANWNDIDDTCILRPDCTVRLRLVASILYAADELHIGADRAPQRNEDWLQIENVESRRHWKRHREINGPGATSHTLTFEINIQTAKFEEDVRSSVLVKALGAVRDMKAQIVKDEPDFALPDVTITFKRDDMWELMSTELLADLVPRTLQEIESRVFEQFESNYRNLMSLESVCTELPTHDDSRLRLRRQISDMVQEADIVAVEDGSHFVLSTDMRKSQAAFALCRSADELDELFYGSLYAKHESEMYSSAFGSAHIETHVLPKVANAFGVHLNKEAKDSELLTVIRKSPTAALVFQSLRKSTGVIVERDVFSIMLLSCMFHDCLRNPNIVLDSQLRGALQKVCESVVGESPRVLRLAKELALSLGLSLDQLRGILGTSKEMSAELRNQNRETDIQTITFSQQFPIKEVSLSMGHIMLAGRRANKEIVILNTEIAPLAYKSSREQPSKEQIHSLSIGPGVANPIRSSLRTTIEIDEQSRVVTFSCRKLDPTSLNEDAPFILHLSPPSPGLALKMDIEFHFPSVTVDTLRQTIALEQFIDAGEYDLRVHVEGLGTLGSHHHAKGSGPKIPLPVSKDLAERINSLPESFPIPWFIRNDVGIWLRNCEPGDTPAKVEEIIKKLTEAPPEVTSVTLRVSTAKGVDFREEFLGFLPIGSVLSPTIAAGGQISQEKLDSDVKKMEKAYTISMKCREDYATLSKDVQEWLASGDPKDFPFRLSQDDREFHDCKTEVSIISLPKIDRRSYIERPVVFRLRPLNEIEQRVVEYEFWKAVNDAQREALVAEIITEIKHEQGGQQIETHPLPD